MVCVTAHTLDCSGLLCPLPVIRTQDRLESLSSGDELEVLCTDPGALHDIPAWSRIHGHELLTVDEQDHHIRFRIRKA